jgi:hypothetical protein
MKLREPTEGEQLLYNRIVMLEDAYNKERERADKAEAENERLRATLERISSREPIPAACYQIADKALGLTHCPNCEGSGKEWNFAGTHQMGGHAEACHKCNGRGLVEGN